MVYEHRSYMLLPGKRAEFMEIFGKQLMPLFAKYGGKVVGTWWTDVGESNEFIYLLAFNDLGQRDDFWKTFRQDEAFQDYQRRGPFVANATNKIIRPTPYSPLQ
ncbi:MAG: NIPSNAP family protein [Chloroflexota bacterium]